MQLFESKYFYLIGYSSRPSVSLNADYFHESDLSGMLGFFSEMKSRKESYKNYWGTDVRLDYILICDDIIENNGELFKWMRKHHLKLQYFYLVSKLDKKISPLSNLYLDIQYLKVKDEINLSIDAAALFSNELMELQLSIISKSIDKKLVKNHWYFGEALRKLNSNIKIKSSVKA